MTFAEPADTTFISGVVHSDATVLPPSHATELLSRYSNFVKVLDAGDHPAGRHQPRIENTFILSSWCPPATAIGPSRSPMLVSYGLAPGASGVRAGVGAVGTVDNRFVCLLLAMFCDLPHFVMSVFLRVCGWVRVGSRTVEVTSCRPVCREAHPELALHNQIRALLCGLLFQGRAGMYYVSASRGSPIISHDLHKFCPGGIQRVSRQRPRPLVAVRACGSWGHGCPLPVRPQSRRTRGLSPLGHAHERLSLTACLRAHHHIPMFACCPLVTIMKSVRILFSSVPLLSTQPPACPPRFQPPSRLAPMAQSG